MRDTPVSLSPPSSPARPSPGSAPSEATNPQDRPMKPLRLGVNIDHVATVRNACGGLHPDPLDAALAAIGAGADGITAHLREDRRHIRDQDLARSRAAINAPLNMEMAATKEMVRIALATPPQRLLHCPRTPRRGHHRGRARRRRPAGDVGPARRPPACRTAASASRYSSTRTSASCGQRCPTAPTSWNCTPAPMPTGAPVSSNASPKPLHSPLHSASNATPGTG